MLLVRMDRRVVVEAAVPVYDVETADEALRIAVSKTGEMLNPDLNYVEISMGSRESPSGEELPPAFVAADEALVALELSMTVFNVERDEHASRIARKEIGQRLENIPLSVLRVEDVPDDEDASEKPDETDRANEAEDGDEARRDEVGGRDEMGNDEESANGDDTDGDDLLPEFEEMVDDG